MECKHHHDDEHRRTYNITVNEVVVGNSAPTFEFDFNTHHDLGKMAKAVAERETMSEKHSQELVLGMRLLHHVLKKYPDKKAYAALYAAVEAFKAAMKAAGVCTCEEK